MKNHYLEAIGELQHVPETHLLEQLSAALGDNSTRLEILQPFHSLCFNLLKLLVYRSHPSYELHMTWRKITLIMVKTGRSAVA